jgi:septal ring factor EnvC (AmiA/AmiB activator)
VSRRDYFAAIRREHGAETCPTIDGVLGRIGAARAILRDPAGYRRPTLAIYRETVDAALDALAGQDEHMETIRATTGSLRDALAAALEQIEALTCSRDEHEAAADKLRDQLKDSEGEVERLQQHIDTIERAAEVARKYGDAA